MKKIKFFLPFAAVALLASCTDKVDGPNPDNGEEGALSAYFTVAISQISTTRTETGNQGSEDGQGNESKIYSAMLVFTDNDDNVIAKSDVVNLTEEDYDNNHKTSKDQATKVFEVPGAKTSLGSSDAKKVYVICNLADPYASSTGFYTGQKTMALPKPGTGYTSDYWKGGIDGTTSGFLMTSKASKEWDPSQKALSTDKENPTDLGTIEVQRAMARFDIAKTYTTEVDLEQSVNVEFDAAALVNISKNFNLFKATSKTQSTDFEICGTETAFNFVQDPFGTDKANLVFPADYNGDDKPDPCADYFWYPYGSTLPKNLDWVLFSNMTKEDQADYTPPTGDPSTTGNDPYYVGFYCSPNSIYTLEELQANYDVVATAKPAVNSQKHLNTTGVVFRGKLTCSNTNIVPTTGNNPIYAYNGILFGTQENIENITLNPNGDYNNEVVAGVIKGIKDVTVDETVTGLTDQLLIDNGFVKYTPEVSSGSPVYYAYYYYWNRHNDNNNDRVMGNMEFAVVRNNVYKLTVTSVTGLGLPGDKTPDDPNDEDETLSGFFKVQVKVVPWEVRYNDVEF